MSNMDGLEALSKIVEVDPDAVVIMLTAQASRKAVEKSGEEGAPGSAHPGPLSPGGQTEPGPQ